MIRFFHWVLPGLATLCLCACGGPPPPPPRAADAGAQGGRLARIVERYWDENAALTPWYSWGGADMERGEPPAENIATQLLADSLALERRYLSEILSVPQAGLDAESKLTYDLFRRQRALAIEGFTYPYELLPVNPYDGMPQRFALMASAAERVALSSAKDYESWRLRSESFVRWTNQAIVNMRDGMRRGYTLPRVLVEKTLPQLAALGDDTQANMFYQSMRAAPGSTDDAGRTPLSGELTAFLKDKILPSYRVLHDFLQNEYLARARNSVGLSALPLGDAWYAYLVKRATDGTLTPAQLHALGLAEVERVHQRVQTLLAETPFPGNAQGFFAHVRSDPRFSYRSAAELLGAYRDVKLQVASTAPALFAAFPRSEFGIRSVEAYRDAAEPAASYRPRAPNGMIAAVLFVNTAALDTRPAILVASQFLREAVPGHHYQLELQRERADLPRFRRFGGAPAFVDGWGLYAATLGDELGLYPDPEAKFGPLIAQMNCAAGLVIDTGLHAQGWTRQQALEYLHAQVPGDDAAAEEVVDRAVALPADALACTVGFLKIQGLRSLAQQTLGARFDLRDFHTEVIKDGAIPLDALDAKIRQWVAAGGTATGIAAIPPDGDSR
ncbi:MAG TPA: DUF885 domain-containing protein [Steroidobacteraceae bacterium]|nr:DUF885 domain-containing protein [Steroidobacteraceae bacterium]